jgi:hypothetical protein
MKIYKTKGARETEIFVTEYIFLLLQLATVSIAQVLCKPDRPSGTNSVNFLPIVVPLKVAFMAFLIEVFPQLLDLVSQ